MNWKKFIFVMGMISLYVKFSLCQNLPQGAVPVSSFDKERYLGKWYEIARMDFWFEKDLNNTTAEYSLNKDGSIRVENKGFNYKKKIWKKAVGKAKFVKSPDIGMLKVSFFGPFYAPYNVIAIDNDYKYALVVGKNLKYLWILSREPQIPQEVKEEYLKKAEELGYNISALVWVEHK